MPDSFPLPRSLCPAGERHADPGPDPADLAPQRRYRRHGGWDHLIAAPLWPLPGANPATLLRTRDAVGACLAVPRLPWVPEALARGNTLRRPACVHWTGREACRWLQEQRSAGARVIGVELAEEAVRHPARSHR